MVGTPSNVSIQWMCIVAWIVAKTLLNAAHDENHLSFFDSSFCFWGADCFLFNWINVCAAVHNQIVCNSWKVNKCKTIAQNRKRTNESTCPGTVKTVLHGKAICTLQWIKLTNGLQNILRLLEKVLLWTGPKKCAIMETS